MIRTRVLTSLFFLLAACSYSPPEDQVLKIFGEHSYREHDPEELRYLLRKKGPAGLKDLDPYAAVIEKKLAIGESSSSPPPSAGFLAGRAGAWYLVLKVFRDSPAEKAGLREGDRLLELNGYPAGSEGFLKALAAPGSLRIRGATRSKSGFSEFETELEPVPFLPARIFGFYEPVTKTAFMRVDLFFEGSAGIFASGLDIMSRYGVRNLIVDLRGNPGGLPPEAAEILKLFAPRPGPVMGIYSRQEGYRRIYRAAARGRYSRLRSVVLTDGRTAMSAEVFAASMQDMIGARLIGSESAGSVSITKAFALAKGRGLQISVARLMPSSARELEGSGLAPDVQAGGSPFKTWVGAPSDSLLNDAAYRKAIEYLGK